MLISYLFARRKIRKMTKRERIEYVKKAIKEYREKFDDDDFIVMSIADINLADCLYYCIKENKKYSEVFKKDYKNRKY